MIKIEFFLATTLLLAIASCNDGPVVVKPKDACDIATVSTMLDIVEENVQKDRGEMDKMPQRIREVQIDSARKLSEAHTETERFKVVLEEGDALDELANDTSFYSGRRQQREEIMTSLVERCKL